ncbi:hypothetical protein TNCV_3142761 [Trichonephila clavipes]|nr:hypothetical protein TNCV_3142761 [Trichonephila clavipes]
MFHQYNAPSHTSSCHDENPRITAVTPKCLGGPLVDHDLRNVHSGSKATREPLEKDLVMLNHSRVTRTTSEVVTPLFEFQYDTNVRALSHDRFSVHQLLYAEGLLWHRDSNLCLSNTGLDH